MKFTPKKINLFTFFKLPSAYLTGVRLIEITEKKAIVKVKHRWINQNPFKSMFWAVQGMAAELSTGVLVMKQISDSGKRISMLVTNMNAEFTKKATGKILFECKEGLKLQNAIEKAISTEEGQKIILTAEGSNADGMIVSKFEFEWSLKLKK